MTLLKLRTLPLFSLLGISLLTSNATAQVTETAQPKLSKAVLSQISSLLEEKANRTPAQKKLTSSLLYRAKMVRGEQVARGIRRLNTDIPTRINGNSPVVIRGQVTPRLLKTIKQMGGEIFAAFPDQETVDAALNVGWLESLATLPEVRFIGLPPQVSQDSGSVTSEGDFRHLANQARAQYGVTGAGLRIGVLSDSVNNQGQLNRGIASGDIPPLAPANQPLPSDASSTIIQDLTPTPDVTGRDEGAALLEVIHDLAPGASLFFATGFISEASFAQYIRDLRNIYGCDIIMDDVRYSDESPFQDSTVARAVNDVTADGALYFASAGNAGSQHFGNGSNWEGDFVDGGPANVLPSTGTPLPSKTVNGRLHQFSTTQNWNQFTTAPSYVELFWADPLGGSTNDYDLIVTNSDGTEIIAAATDVQDGTQDPFEQPSFQITPGSRLYIVKTDTAEPRYMRLAVFNRRPLQFHTKGNTFGHNSAAAAFGIAATFAGGGDLGMFTPAADLEMLSSDGPRRMFFASDGTPYTPGNYSSTGGIVRLKPDLTAADGVTTNNQNYPVFYGTSAAAPHAAAIAALVKSYNPLLTTSEMRTTLTQSATDLRTPGWDEASGYGIIMPVSAIQFLDNFLVPGSVQLQSFTSDSAVITWKTNLPSSSQIDYGATSGYGQTKTVSEAVTTHSVTLSGLTPSTTYHFRAFSQTPTGSLAKASGDLTFATAAAPGALANIVVSRVTLTRNPDGTLTAAVVLLNNSTGAGSHVAITSAVLGSSNTTTPLSVAAGDIAPNGSTTVNLTFPSSPAGRGQLQIQGTFDGGYFSSTTRVVIPN